MIVQFHAKNSDRIRNLMAVAKNERDCGHLHVQIASLKPERSTEEFLVDAPDCAAKYMESYGLAAMAVYEIACETASWIATCILWRDLAHGAAMIDFKKAGSRASEFIQLCSLGRKPAVQQRFFTNGHCCLPGPPIFDVGGKRITGYFSATKSTFDTGIIVVTPFSAGLLWAEDED